MGQVDWARELARSLLEQQLRRRWAHTQGVAAQAETLRPILGDDAHLLVAAAWLHDIGYSPSLICTGFHPLDGARYLRDAHSADLRLCNLVAFHSGAIFEAEERGVDSELRHEFRPESEGLSQALTYCDMTTGPDGESLSPQDRLIDIQTRYDADHPVSRAIRQCAPTIILAVESIRRRLANPYR